MGEYQIWVIVVVVVLSILDAMMKKARKRGAGLPEGDGPLSEGSVGDGSVAVEREDAEPVGGPAPRAPSQPRPRPGPQPQPWPQPQPSTAGQSPPEKRPSAFDVLVPPEVRKELEDILSGGGGQHTGQGAPSPTASGPSGASGSRSAPVPGTPVPDSAPHEPDDPWHREPDDPWREPDDPWHEPGEPSQRAPLPKRSRVPRPIEVRSRAPRSVEARTREPAHVRADSPPAPAHRPPEPDRLGFGTVGLGFGTINGLRRVVVAREVLGPPVAMRDEKELGTIR